MAMVITDRKEDTPAADNQNQQHMIIKYGEKHETRDCKRTQGSTRSADCRQIELVIGNAQNTLEEQPRRKPATTGVKFN